MKILKDILTTKDGETYDALKVAAVFGGLSMLLVTLLGYDPLAYGTGFGAIITATGIGVKFKAATEPGGEG